MQQPGIIVLILEALRNRELRVTSDKLRVGVGVGVGVISAVF